MSGLEYIPLEPEDTFSFECVQCGSCCRNVIDAIPVESLDAFRLAKNLKQPIEDFIGTFTVMRLITPNFPMLFLKTKPESGEIGECIFLNDGCCSVQVVKPRTCRMYPLSAGPGDIGKFEYLWVAKQHHQYRPGATSVADWMSAALSGEDRNYLRLEYEFVKQSGKYLMRLPERRNDEVLKNQLVFRYFMYDLRSEFMPQYEDNIKLSLQGLKRIAMEVQNGFVEYEL